MKKAYLCMLGMIGMTVQQAYAEPPRAGDLTLNPAANYTFYDGDHHLEDSFGWQFGLEYAYTEHWAAEAVYAQTNAGGKSGAPGAKERRLDANVLYYINNYGGWVPYLAAGVGGTKFDANRSIERPELNVGGGTRYFFNDRFSMRGDVRFVQSGINSTNFSDVVVSLGLSYAFPLHGETATTSVAAAPVAPAALPAPAVKPTPAVEPVATTPAPTQPPAEMPSIDLHLTFASGSDKIEPQFKSHIAEVADFMKKYPSTTAEIEGHTDNSGKAAYNRALSKRRAEAVKAVLVKDFGIDAARLSAVGYGPDRPIADNKTPAGRAQNRRVIATFKQ